MDSFDVLVEASANTHGHLCPGQVVGVRMAMLGCRLLGLDNPKSREQIKKLLVYVEMDRCTADAVAYVAGVKLGRRSLKFMDYGIMAATFINLETDKSYRIISTEESRELSDIYAPEVAQKSQRQISAYKRMPDSVLFRVQRVHVNISRFDLPGPTKQKITCSQCGQVIRDGREIGKKGQMLCRPCSGNCYFSHAMEISWPSMNWSPSQEKNGNNQPGLNTKSVLNNPPIDVNSIRHS